jgi:hypothetical protein
VVDNSTASSWGKPAVAIVLGADAALGVDGKGGLVLRARAKVSPRAEFNCLMGCVGLLTEVYCGLFSSLPLKKGAAKTKPPESTSRAQPRELSVDANFFMALKSRPRRLLLTAVPLPCENAVN